MTREHEQQPEEMDLERDDGNAGGRRKCGRSSSSDRDATAIKQVHDNLTNFEAHRGRGGSTAMEVGCRRDIRDSEGSSTAEGSNKKWKGKQKLIVGDAGLPPKTWSSFKTEEPVDDLLLADIPFARQFCDEGVAVLRADRRDVQVFEAAAALLLDQLLEEVDCALFLPFYLLQPQPPLGFIALALKVGRDVNRPEQRDRERCLKGVSGVGDEVSRPVIPGRHLPVHHLHLSGVHHRAGNPVSEREIRCRFVFSGKNDELTLHKKAQERRIA